MTLQVTSMSMRVQGASAIGFSRAGILQRTHWLHLLRAISFLPCPVAYWQLLIPLSRLSAFSFLRCQLSMGERESSRQGRGRLSLSLNPSRVQISLSCACPSSASHTAQHRLLIFLCSLCLPVAYVGCLSFYTNPKLPGARHNEILGTTNMGARVDCWDANKITAIIGI